MVHFLLALIVKEILTFKIFYGGPRERIDTGGTKLDLPTVSLSTVSHANRKNDESKKYLTIFGSN